jgi:hypothetical protein
MKALVTAFALLSFVAATTVPYVANAATSTEQTKKKTTKKPAAKKTSHKKSTKKPAKKATAA